MVYHMEGLPSVATGTARLYGGVYCIVECTSLKYLKPKWVARRKDGEGRFSNPKGRLFK